MFYVCVCYTISRKVSMSLQYHFDEDVAEHEIFRYAIPSELQKLHWIIL